MHCSVVVFSDSLLGATSLERILSPFYLPGNCGAFTINIIIKLMMIITIITIIIITLMIIAIIIKMIVVAVYIY